MQHAHLCQPPPPLTAVRCRRAALRCRCSLSAATIRTRRRVRSSRAFPTSVCVIDATTLLSGGKNSESINQSRTSQNGEREQQQDGAIGGRLPLPCARCTSRVVTLRPAAMRGSIGLLQRRVAAPCDACHSFASASRIHRSRLPCCCPSLAFPALFASPLSACCGEKKIRSAYHLWCTDCAKGANACPKCLQNRDIVEASEQNGRTERRARQPGRQADCTALRSEACSHPIPLGSRMGVWSSSRHCCASCL